MSKQVESHVTQLYHLDKMMGSGAYGHVWKVTEKATNKIFALKKIFDAFRNSTDAQRTYRQITVLYQLSHNNIIKLEKVIKAKNNKDLYLVFEYMESDLHCVIGQGVLETIHFKYIIYQILRGIKYIHSAQIIHRDLKPSNVLINSQCTVKLCDFGLVRSIAQTNQQDVVMSQQVATRWYRSPEVLLGSKIYGKPADMWSIGCIIAEMLTGQPLFPGNSTLDQLQKILAFTGRPSHQDIQSLQNELTQQLINQVNLKKKSLQSYFAGISKQLVNLVVGLLQFNPNKRLTVDEALNSQLIQQLRDQQNQTLFKGTIHIPVDDNIKLGLKKYREIIYDDIRKRYASADLKQQKKVSLRSKKSSESKLADGSKKNLKENDYLKKQLKKKGFTSNFMEYKKQIKKPSVEKCLKPSLKSNSSGYIKPIQQKITKKVIPATSQINSKVINSNKLTKKSINKVSFTQLHKIYKYLK